MEIDYVNTAYALRASYVPTIERVATRAVRWSPSDGIEGFKTLIAAAVPPLGAYILTCM